MAESGERIQTLGILFVHGIGTQRHGDTLLQCGTVIYDWLRKWITPLAESEGIRVEPQRQPLPSSSLRHSRRFSRRSAAVGGLTSAASGLKRSSYGFVCVTAFFRRRRTSAPTHRPQTYPS